MNLTCAHHRLSRLIPHAPPRLQPRPAREAPLQEEHARRATRMPRSHGKREHGQQQAGAADHRAVESAFKGRTIASTNRAWLQMARIEHKHAQRAQRIGAVRCASIRNRSTTDRSRWSAAAFAAKGVHASRRSCSSLFRAMATASSLHDRTGCGTQATNRARACGTRASTDTSAAVSRLNASHRLTGM